MIGDKMQETNDFLVIGKVLAADLDAEGNLHILLKNSNSFWAETAAKRLRQLEGRVIKLDIKEWETSTAKKEISEKYP